MAAEFGGRERLDDLLEQHARKQKLLEAKPAGTKPTARGRVMNRQQAEQIAADLSEHDGRIRAGKLT